MRPPTLCSAIERILAGEPREKALAEFLDVFYGAASDDARLAAIIDEPPLTGDDRLDALAAAIADYLARQNRLPSVPRWVAVPKRRLKEPWFTTPCDGPGMREFLVFSSPAEFIQHNIFTEERPLRRARTGR